MEEKFKKKVISYKGFKIHHIEESSFLIYTNDEWSYGVGCRYHEHEAGNLLEAKEFIDCY